MGNITWKGRSRLTKSSLKSVAVGATGLLGIAIGIMNPAGEVLAQGNNGPGNKGQGGGRSSLGQVGGSGARGGGQRGGGAQPNNPGANNPGRGAGQNGLNLGRGNGLPSNLNNPLGRAGGNEPNRSAQGGANVNSQKPVVPSVPNINRGNPNQNAINQLNRATSQPSAQPSSQPNVTGNQPNNNASGNRSARPNDPTSGERRTGDPLSDLLRSGGNLSRPGFGSVNRAQSNPDNRDGRDAWNERQRNRDGLPGQANGDRSVQDRQRNDLDGRNRNQRENDLNPLQNRSPWNSRPTIGGVAIGRTAPPEERNPNDRDQLNNRSNDRRDGNRDGNWDGRRGRPDWNDDWNRYRNNSIGNRPSWARPNYSGPGGAYGNWNQNSWGWGNNNVNNWQSQWYNNGVHQHYHGWYNGGWNNNWGNSWYAPVLWGGLGWGLGSWSSNYGYGVPYSNPYYGSGYAGTLPYNYAQPVVIAAYSSPQWSGDVVQGSAGVQQYTNAENAESERALVTFDVGLRQFKQGNYSEASARFEEALRARPNDPVIHEVRALALFAQANYLESAITLNSLLAAAPGMDWTTLSGLYGNVDDYTRQLRALERYCREKRDDPAAYFVLSYHYLVIDAKAEATKTLQAVVRLQPNDVTAKRMLEALTSSNNRSKGEELPGPNVAELNKSTGQNPITNANGPNATTTKSDVQTDLVGIWQAKAEDSVIELEIKEDSKFSWKASGGNQDPLEIEGTVMTAPDTVVFESPKQGAMAGTVIPESDNSWEFRIDGAPAAAPGLKFVRK